MDAPEAADPILRHIPQDPPQQWAMLGQSERSLRGRVFLLLWCAGYEQIQAWALAMGDLADVRETYAGWVKQVQAHPAGLTPDQVLERMNADRATIAAVAGRRSAQA